MEESDKVLYVALLSIPGVTSVQLYYHRLQLIGKLYSRLYVSSATHCQLRYWNLQDVKFITDTFQHLLTLGALFDCP